MTSDIPNIFVNGHYNDEGCWVKQKYCLLPCHPSQCDCEGPHGTYSTLHDKHISQDE